MEKEILDYLRKNLTPDRLRHVRSVTAFAEKLARRHGLDPERARLAAALHDAARCWSREKLAAYVRRRKLKIPALNFVARRQPVLLHSYVGADLARALFGVKDREVLSAIAKHSLGAVRMTPLEKCIYLADLLAPGREFYGANRLRRLALKDLDGAFREGVAVKIRYVLSCGEALHPEVVRVWNRETSRRGNR